MYISVTMNEFLLYSRARAGSSTTSSSTWWWLLLLCDGGWLLFLVGRLWLLIGVCVFTGVWIVCIILDIEIRGEELWWILRH